MEVPELGDGASMKKLYGVKSGPNTYDGVIIVCDKKEDADEIAGAISQGNADKMVVELPRITSIINGIEAS